MSRRISRVLSLLLVCLVIGLIFAGQLRLLSVISGRVMPWKNVISWELTRWLLWIVFVPLIIHLIRRYPFQPGPKKRVLAIHAVASSIISFVHLVFFSLIYWVILQAIESATHGIPLMEMFRKPQENPYRVFRMIFSLDFHIGIVVYWVILAGHQAIAYSRRAADLKSELVSAQLEALKMQLHPHFLFNTLNSISALLHKNVDAADEMIGELGNFLRLTLQSRTGHEVSLEQELRFLKSYLEIEKIRFQNRLVVEMEIDPQTLVAGVPHLILQPIIENAIRHGIAPRTETGKIEVRSEKRNLHLRLQVLDNGPGISVPHSEGIGLRNVRERLGHLYGTDYQFRLSNRKEGGLNVEMEIPFRAAPLNPEEQNV